MTKRLTISGDVWLVIVRWTDDDCDLVDSIWTDESEAKERQMRLAHRRDVAGAWLCAVTLNQPYGGVAR